ncbi:hypothetical protein [Occultella kanbiaonis]|uniref:hypothetical protein n=1 Tax=Occultella kanbiaonis TaxID=2675754 RepID=UPI0012B7782D|nr:hypothetical protein [Occultella kanbiaonis]
MSDDDSARAELLKSVWEEIRGFSADNVRNYPAAARAIDAGASAEDVSRAMTSSGYEVAFALLLLLSDEIDEASDLPQPAERFLGLHESLLTSDPTGNEGADLFT